VPDLWSVRVILGKLKVAPERLVIEIRSTDYCSRRQSANRCIF
jgi:hypothetical protein